MRPVYFRIAFVSLALYIASPSFCQMSGGDNFLRGHYVEVGIRSLGSYGSSGSAPAGYHPHLGYPGSNLGFVADPGMTGWSTSTSSHYMGDYFYPGFPFEGWDMQIAHNRAQGYSSGSSFVTSGLSGTGANISYTATGSLLSAVWQGTFDSVILTQETLLDTNDLYFLTKVTFTNTAHAPKDSIYYFRSLDPDNDESWAGGGFPTHNIITSQPPSDTVSIVTAIGYSSSAAYLALGSGDTASRAVIYNAWPITVSQDLSAVYDGSYSGSGGYYGPVGTDHPGDIAIGVISFIPHLATVDSAADSVLRTTSTAVRHPANSKTIYYFYSFSPAATDSAALHASGGVHSSVPTAVKNINNTNNIAVYPNPAHNFVSITNLSTTDHIMVYDMMGRVANNTWYASHDGTSVFDYSAIPAGSYLLVVSDASGNVKARIPVKKQ